MEKVHWARAWQGTVLKPIRTEFRNIAPDGRESTLLRMAGKAPAAPFSELRGPN